MKSKRSDIRRLAMQVLYQIDVRGETDSDAIRDALEEGFDSPQAVKQAFALAWPAWRQRKDADAIATELAPDWPTHRQPPVDRAIIRLAYHEMVTGHAPVKVVLNEAVELAKQFGSEHSPAFINGVLDKMARRLPVPAPESGPASEPSPSAPASPSSPKAWLDDAIGRD